MLIRSSEGTRDFFQDKLGFYEFTRSIAEQVTPEEYLLMDSNYDSPDIVAWFGYSQDSAENSETKPTQPEIQDFEVFLNTGMFQHLLDTPQLMNEIQQVVIRHEAAEMWHLAYLKMLGEYEDFGDAGNSPAHKIALKEEWQLAYELGCQDEYLHTISKWAEIICKSYGFAVACQFWYENLNEYFILRSNGAEENVPGERFELSTSGL